MENMKLKRGGGGFVMNLQMKHVIRCSPAHGTAGLSMFTHRSLMSLDSGKWCVSGTMFLLALNEVRGLLSIIIIACEVETRGLIHGSITAKTLLVSSFLTCKPALHVKRLGLRIHYIFMVLWVTLRLIWLNKLSNYYLICPSGSIHVDCMAYNSFFYGAVKQMPLLLVNGICWLFWGITNHVKPLKH